MKNRILLVEDDQDIRELIALRLRREGYEVQEVADGKSALSFLKTKLKPQAIDLVILDWMLPSVSGIEILSEMKRNKDLCDVSVLLLTAKGETSDIVMGLETGADDYVTKPFEWEELKARVRALIRRTSSSSVEKNQTVIQLGDLRVDPEAYEAYNSTEKLDLTKSEFKLLVTLLSHRGRVLTREKLIQAVQGAGVNVVDRTVDTHVFGLRKKMGSCGELIETVRGVGYRVME